MRDASPEAREDGVESATETVDGIVAGEHAAVDAANRRRGLDDLQVTGKGPRVPRNAEARNLQCCVRPRGKQRKVASPRGEAFRTAVRRQAGVVEDDRGCGKIGRKLGGGVEMPPWRLQIERQAMAREQRVAVAPA